MAKSNAAVRVGAFVAGGLAILAGAVIAFGSGAFSRGGVERVVVFGESLQGLQVGAPVTYNGVPVGSVSRIGGELNAEQGEIVTGVALAIEGGVIQSDDPDLDIGDILARLVDQGLRAQLATQSLVTGALYVRLIFAPNADAYAAPLEFLGAPTLPAVQSDRERLGRFAETLGADLPQVLARVSTAADRVSDLFDDENRANIAETLRGIAAFSQSLAVAGPGIETVVVAANETMARLAHAAQTLDDTAGALDGFVADNSAVASDVIAQADLAAQALAAAAAEMRALTSENRAPIREFTSEALPQYRALAAEATSMVRQIEALARRLEEDGAGFLLGGEPVREYQPRSR